MMDTTTITVFCDPLQQRMLLVGFDAADVLVAVGWAADRLSKFSVCNRALTSGTMWSGCREFELKICQLTLNALRGF